MSKGSIYYRKDGRWEARLSLGTINGKRQSRSFYGKTHEEAEQKLLAATIYTDEPQITEMTVKELCAEWLYVIATRVKISTWANYRMKIHKHIIPSFGDMPCCEITSRSVYNFIENKVQNGLSNRYVTDIVVLLKSVFKYARKEYHIVDPFEDIAMPKSQKPDVRLLTLEEQSLLKMYIKQRLSLITLGIALSLSMGLRIGEVCGLQWQDIDLEKRILSVKRTIQRVAVQSGNKKTEVIVMPPKSASSIREIPIPTDVLAMLKKFSGNAESYILSDSKKPIEPRKLQYHFAKILKNVDLPSVKFHSLRHAFATRAVELGFDIKTLSEILGHSKVEITLNRYVHSNIDRKRSCMALFELSA